MPSWEFRAQSHTLLVNARRRRVAGALPFCQIRQCRHLERPPVDLHWPSTQLRGVNQVMHRIHGTVGSLRLRQAIDRLGWSE